MDISGLRRLTECIEYQTKCERAEKCFAKFNLKF